MKKKLASKVIAGVLTSAMVLGMAACGNDNQGNSSENSSGNSQSSTPAVVLQPRKIQEVLLRRIQGEVIVQIRLSALRCLCPVTMYWQKKVRMSII